jgi:hypothetical protein
VTDAACDDDDASLTALAEALEAALEIVAGAQVMSRLGEVRDLALRAAALAEALAAEAHR